MAAEASQSVTVDRPVSRRVVPSRRLVWLAFAFVAAGVVAAAIPGGPALWLLTAALAVATGCVDVVLGRERLARWRLSAPPLVRAAAERTSAVALTLTRPEEDAGGLVRLGLETPATVEGAPVETDHNLPANGGSHLLGVSVRPLGRGRHALGRVHLATGSSLGLWDLRATWETSCLVRVHPDLASERRAFAAAFMPQLSAGLKLQRQIGRGREFEKLRDYQPGDGFDEIHWKATARRGKPVTKVFQVERTQEVYVLLDASRLSGRPLPGADGVLRPTLERQVTAALALAGLARRQGDRLGLVLFADQVLRFIAAGSSAGHFNACREYLSDLETHRVSADYRELFTQVAARLRRRALLVILTDLSDAVSAEQFTAHLDLLTRRHLVLVVQPKPTELAPIFHGPPPSGESGILDALAWHWEWETVDKTLASLHVAGARGALLEGPAYVTGILNHYMNLRRQQAL